MTLKNKIYLGGLTILLLFLTFINLPKVLSDRSPNREFTLLPESLPYFDAKPKPAELPPFLFINGKAFQDWAADLNSAKPKENYTASVDLPFYNGSLMLTDLLPASSGPQSNLYYGQFAMSDNGYDITGKFELDLTNIINPSLNLEILSGKVKKEAGEASRINGTIRISETDGLSRVDGKIQMGSLSYAGLQFTGAQIELNGTQHQSLATITGQMSGHTGTILQAEGLFQGTRLQNLKGWLSMESPQAFLQTLLILATGTQQTLPTNFQDIPPVTLYFEETQRSSANQRRFALRLENLENHFRGLAMVSPENKTLRLSAEIKSLPGLSLQPTHQLKDGTEISKVFANLHLNNTQDDSFGYVEP